MAVFTFCPPNQNKIKVHPRIKKGRNKEPEDVEHTKLTEQLVVSLSQFCSVYCAVAVKACYEIIGSFTLEERSAFACQFVISHSQCLVSHYLTSVLSRKLN